MTMNDLLNIVRPTGLVSADSILDAIKLQSESRDMELDYRGSLSKCNNFVDCVWNGIQSEVNSLCYSTVTCAFSLS